MEKSSRDEWYEVNGKNNTEEGITKKVWFFHFRQGISLAHTAHDEDKPTRNTEKYERILYAYTK